MDVRPDAPAAAPSPCSLSPPVIARLTKSAEAIPVSPPLVLARHDSAEAISVGGNRDCRAEFTPSTLLKTGLSESEILRLRLRMTKK